MADKSQMTVFRNIAYDNYKQTNKQTKLDIYIPKNQAPIAVVIFFYGGCWGKCSRLHKNDYLFVAETLAQYGIATVIPDFRQYPEFGLQTILQDSSNATFWLMQNAEKYGINKSKIFLMGHSSGAHIAAMLTNRNDLLAENLKNIAGFIGLAGPYGYTPDDNFFKPIDLVDGDEAPQLILHGTADNRVGKINSIYYAEVLAESDVKHELVLLDNISHAKLLLSFAKPFRKNSIALEKIIQFITKFSLNK